MVDRWFGWEEGQLLKSEGLSLLRTLALGSGAENGGVSLEERAAGYFRAIAAAYSGPASVALAKDEATKKDSLRIQATEDQKTYDSLNFRDDQFDLSDTLIALAISLLALTSLTKKEWLFWVAMVPTALGAFMGLAGLMGWNVHPDSITRLLS